MKLRIVLRPEAEDELFEAAKWYEEKVKGLGHNFISCVESELNVISSNPERYPVVYKNIRRALIKKFPFGIYFLQTEDCMIILAIIHERRNPSKWEGRIS